MCYSAQIKADYLKFVRQTGAKLDIREFFRVFWTRSTDSKVKVPKAMEVLFAQPASDQEHEIAAQIDAFKKAGKRLDMGKCCLHFKELDDLELTSVATVIAMSTPKEYIAYYRRVKGLA